MGAPKIVGILDDAQLSFTCSDPECKFYQRRLPLHVVDEVLLGDESRLPSILIATVDKFAQLPKKVELRRLFGIDSNGEQARRPPALIIQDELHLISEALGSVVGAYEPVIHALCERGGLKPKIVCSTATVRTYKGQIRSLFARTNVSVFPPPELSILNNFFVSVPLDEKTGLPKSRKAYVGIFGSGYQSFQAAEARVMASLLQAPKCLEPELQDPYWTLVSYFNSLRELGTTITMLESSVWREARRINSQRAENGSRRPTNRIELTSRASSRELSQAFKRLENEWPGMNTQRAAEARAIDVCLATSIVEVGIDVPRLSLMLIVGQPKKVSTYIQATGRVGRTHPGLIACLYDQTRKRDRSIYESFRTFHERMYAMVEPTTLTPFASPVQERTIPAVLAAIARLTSSEQGLANHPTAISTDELRRLRELVSDDRHDPDGYGIGTQLAEFFVYLKDWVSIADPAEMPRLRRSIVSRLKEWDERQRTRWHRWSFLFDADSDEPVPMMLDFDPALQSKLQYNDNSSCWWLPNSMRDVDSEAQVWFSQGPGRTAISDDDLFPPLIRKEGGE